MSLFRKKTHSYYTNKMKSLSKQNNHAVFLYQGKGTPVCTRRKASYTLEAAVVIPLVTAFLTVLLFFFRVLQVEASIQEALVYAGRNAAVVSTATSSDAAALLTATGFFEKEIADDSYVKRYVMGGRAGILLAESKVSGEYIDLRAVYQVKVPIGFFSVNAINLVSESSSRRWTGRDEGEEQKDPTVYYTPTGKVYHLSRNCPYLDLSIRSVGIGEIGGLRNKNGHKYYKCSRCVAKNSSTSTVYITDYGTNYHAKLDCSALKRTVYRAALSEMQGRSACKKCGQKK